VLRPVADSMLVVVVLDYAERRFTLGLFARIRLVGSGTYTAVLTPENAIGTDQSKRFVLIFFFQAEDGIRDATVTGVQTCALPISVVRRRRPGCGAVHSTRHRRRRGVGGRAQAARREQAHPDDRGPSRRRVLGPRRPVRARDGRAGGLPAAQSRRGRQAPHRARAG